MEYRNITIFVNFNTGVFDNPHATYICGVPTSKYYWTGTRIQVDKLLNASELRQTLIKLVKEPYCEPQGNGIYYCPPYFQNRQGIMDCNGKYLVREVTPEQASFLYDVFKTDIYVVHAVEEICKKGTYPVVIPAPNFEERPVAPRFLREAVLQYSVPPYSDFTAYMSGHSTLVVVYPDKTFQTFTVTRYDDLPEIVRKVLESLVRKRYIDGYCETVKTLKYSEYIYKKLIELNEKGVRCYNWSSGS